LSENVPFGEAERKACRAGLERGGTAMQQEGHVSSGKAGRLGGARALRRALFAAVIAGSIGNPRAYTIRYDFNRKYQLAVKQFIYTE